MWLAAWDGARKGLQRPKGRATRLANRGRTGEHSGVGSETQRDRREGLPRRQAASGKAKHALEYGSSCV